MNKLISFIDIFHNNCNFNSITPAFVCLLLFLVITMPMKNDNDPSWALDDEESPLMGTGTASLQDNIIIDAADQAASPLSTNPDLVTGEATKPWQNKPDDVKKIEVVRLPHPNFILYAFYWLEGIAILASVCLLATQVLPLLYMTLHEIGILQLCLRIYIGMFCFCFILVEFETPLPFLQASLLLQTYFSRGFLYTFLGLIGMEEAYSVRVNDMEEHRNEEYHVAWASLFMQVSSWLVVAVGVVYMMCGICCLKVVRDKLKLAYQEKLERYKQLESLT